MEKIMTGLVNRCVFLLVLLMSQQAVAETVVDTEASQADTPVVAARSPAMTIVALSPHSVELLYAIGAGDRIVATIDHADFPVDAKKIPSIGGYYGISIEKVVSLKPDLVVYWQTGNRPEDIERLKSLGITLYNSDAKTLSSVATTLSELGQLTGLQAEADKVAADYLAQLAMIEQQYQMSPPVSVFYQLWPKPLMTVANGSWIQQIISICHGDNIFADSMSEYPQVNVEQVVMAMPQVILQSENHGNVSGIDWGKWPMIPAVKNKHITQLNADLLHRPTPRALLGIRSLCQALDAARKK